MMSGRPERGTSPVEPVTLKILVAGGFGVYWWRSLHGKVFAPDLPTRSVVLLVVVNVVLAGILLLTAT